jgi:hypothetical protein
MLRTLAVLLLTTAPALAWEARSGRICELVHEGESASVRVTYDPAIPEYAIAITPGRPWRQGPIFAMRFDGPRGSTITTDRHVVSGDGATLSVTDGGFGNVLNGLEFNHTATALLGDRAVAVPLEGAAPSRSRFSRLRERPKRLRTAHCVRTTSSVL